MKRTIALQVVMILSISSFAQHKVEWVSTSPTELWKVQKGFTTTSSATGSIDVEVQINKPLQIIKGFGSCFNELGWTSLSLLSDTDRQRVMRELFAPGVGANFTICRMPVGANDFSIGWYSYDESDSDFEMKHFSIDHDLKTLVPFIKNALEYNPSLKLWASPWSPPEWMKYNKFYAEVNFPKNFRENTNPNKPWDNGLKPEQEGREGTNMFIQKEKYYKAYALYFKKFIEAYGQHGIKIGMVMPQNEFNSAQVFPSCTWTAAGLARFVPYLGERMKQIGIDVFFGTVERANPKLVDTILNNSESGEYIKGVGFQWAGKGAIPIIHRERPNLTLYQTEQECGDGQNDWKYCVYSWSLMKHYLDNGANAYMYWNTALKKGGISTWGWKQNSLVSVDTVNKTYKYNYEYYLMKHLSHFVKPGAKRLATNGPFENLLTFMNPDKSIVIVAQNESNEEKRINIKVGNDYLNPLLTADTFNTFLIK